MSITIEAETPGETETLFRVLFDATTIGAGLTSTEAQTLVGQNLRKLAFLNRPPRGAVAASTGLFAFRPPVVACTDTKPAPWTGRAI